MTFYDANLDRKSKKISIITVICAVLIFALFLCMHLYIQVQETRELGEKFLTIFWTNFVVRSAFQSLSFCITFILFYLSTYFVCRNIKKTDSPVLYILDRFWGRVAVCVVLSAVASSFISETVYSRYLMFKSSTDFGLVDPIFGHDIGYYIFSRPFLDALVGSVISVWMVIVLYCLVCYVVAYAVNKLLKFQRISEMKPVVVHNAVNIVIYFLLTAVTYKFRSEEVLYSNVGDFAGAGYTAINVWYNFYRVAPFLLIAIVGVTLFFLFRGKYKAFFVSAAVYPVILIAVSLTAVAVQNLIAEPNEAVKERPYLEHNITYTKLAYGLTNVRETEYSADTELTSADLAANKSSFDSIRITDFDATVDAVNSLQGIRNYYKFNDADITRYNIDGKPTMVSVAVREIDKDNLSGSSKNYANEVFRFTHGFGVVMSPLNKVTTEGQPDFLIKDIPTVSVSGAPEINQPRVYYGETYDDYVVVNSTIKEIDYYENSEEVEYSYEGTGGIKLGFFNRLLYSIKNGDFRMFISQFVTGESKILINRNVRERVQKAAPFLTFDTDPYIVIDGSGRLKWIIDAYTTSSYYPYSQNFGDINYIRNSVKAVVDAYDGNIELYVTDKTDPLILTYMKMYPGVFTDSPLPEDIAEHTVYPEYLFTIQAQMYARYHVSNPNTLYNKSDQWVFSREKHGKDEQDIVPYYNLMDVGELGGDSNFIIMVPYTLANKNNMVGWLAASCDRDSYGNLVAYHFPKGKNVYGTLQIENRIDSDPAISREMTLWGQGGSNVIRGNMLVVPIGGALVYIEPIYIASGNSAGVGGTIPELKRVIVAYGDKIAMEPTLAEALETVFDGTTPPVVSTPDDTSDTEIPIPPQEDTPAHENVDIDNVIDRVIDGYRKAMENSQSGNWKDFGDNMQQLDDMIKQLEEYRNR